MGTHRIEITMVGGHGCDRTAKEGEERAFCGLASCPDCAARALVKAFQAHGAFNHPEARAAIVHWPGGPDEVIDDLVSLRRIKGDFTS